VVGRGPRPARLLAAALNDVTAHRHRAHPRETPACVCRRDPLRYLLAGEGHEDWNVASVLAARGMVHTLPDYLSHDHVDVHVVRLGDGEMVHRSGDGVWRAGSDDVRHRLVSSVTALSGSVVAWIIFAIAVAALIAGLVVMFAHTAETISR